MDEPEKITPAGKIYAWTKLAVLLPKNGPGLPGGLDNDQDYEHFIISWTPAGPDEAFPPGPGQTPGAAASPAGSGVLLILIAKDFLQKINYAIYGERNLFLQSKNLKLDRDLQILIYLFIDECENRRAGYQFILESLAAQIAVNLLRQLKPGLPLPFSKRGTSEKEKISRVIALFKEKSSEEHSLAEVARLTGLSLYHFIRVFKAHTGKTPHEYLLDEKVEKARELLQFSNLSVAEICLRCGFKNPSHFATVFKRKMGKSPSEYRKAIQGTVP